jgi:hypothetical protein
MDMDQSAVFLAGSILTALGFVALVVAVVVVNNILHKYWKPVAIFTPDSWKGFHPPMRFEDQEKIAPHLDENKNKIIG